MKLYYCGQSGDGYGWGTCNKNLSQALRKYFDVLPPPNRPKLNALVFLPIANHDLEPAGPWRGTKTIGYTFFESPLGPNAERNAKQYDLIFCGSTWCKERLAERGIYNTSVLIQGVDHEIFKPLQGTRFGSRFMIFSGGKFEYRKGQDIVIAAFKKYLEIDPNAVLVCAWFNPWPVFLGTMRESRFIKWPTRLNYDTQEEFFTEVLTVNGIPRRNFSVMPMLKQQDLADVMRSTDLGLFPNRCEGGTNLVLMEYAACGKPVLATYGTGHKDILPNHWAWGETMPNKWVEVDPTDLAEHIKNGVSWILDMKQWTWDRAAKTVADALQC